MKQTKDLFDDNTEAFKVRSLNNRFGQFSKATMGLVAHFMGLGDDQATAESKVTDLSNEISDNKPSAKFDYIIGVRQPLIDQVNASTLPHMDAAAKAVVTDNL